MKYKMVACDIDGTLLNSKHQLSQRTKDVIKQAKDKGVLVTLATGRDFTSAQHVAKSLEIDMPIITNDGSFLIHPSDSKVFYESRIERSAACTVVDMLNQYKMSYIIQDEPHSYRNNRMMFLKMLGSMDIFRIMAFRKHMSHHKILKNQAMFEGVSANKIKPFKICVFDENVKALDEITKRIESEFKGTLRISNSGFNGIEIVQTGFSKARGLDVLCNQFNVAPSEVMAIGDSYNDLEMVGFAGLGIAMGNANAALMERAQFVTLSNDSDGVAYALEQFAL